MKDLIKSIIHEGQKRELPEIWERALKIPLDPPQIVSIIGPRRSGKTYLLYAIIRDLIHGGVPSHRIIYLNFEDERLELGTDDLDLILQAYYELYPDTDPGQCYILFDEIQNVPGWERFVRRIFDTISKRVFITGSNANLLSREIATSLRGRTLSYTVYPLRFSEWLNFQGISVDLLDTRSRSGVIKASEDFMRKGGFPEVIGLDEETTRQVLQGYFNTMIFRDIVERYRVAEVQTLKFFVKKVLSGIGKPLSVNRIYKDLRSLGYSVSNNYLYEFQNWCEAVFLTLEVPLFHFSGIKQEKSAKKVYCIDPGLLSAVAFNIAQDRGKLLENTVVLEFIKAGYDLFYFKKNHECDLIVQKDGSFQPVQVSWTVEGSETRSREVRGLKEACEYLGVRSGLILTFDEKEHVEEQGIGVEVCPFYEYFSG